VSPWHAKTHLSGSTLTPIVPILSRSLPTFAHRRKKKKIYYGLERQAKSSARSIARDYKDRQSEMDNPDQRIQEDIASFTSYSLSFSLTVVNTIIDLVR
jgi:hypothetical protein